MKINNLITQPLVFGLVGMCATLTHFCALLVLTQTLHWHPLLVNPIAFLIAFQISFLGHWHYTFRRQKAWQHALPRFFITALIGLTTNQILFWYLLHQGQDYRIAQAITLMTVAVLSFILSKYWSFKIV